MRTRQIVVIIHRTLIMSKHRAHTHTPPHTFQYDLNGIGHLGYLVNYSPALDGIRGATYRTLPPQNWQSSPCQPSGQTQVPFVQTPPFIQELSLMHFPMTTLLQQIINIRSTTNKTNKHFRWLCIECSIINIWAKLFSIFDLATF